MTEDINKLPKWAQYRIVSLENKLKETEHLLERTTPTKLRVSRIYTDPPVYLPDDRGIVFTTPDGDIEVRLNDNDLEIYAHDKSISVLPQITNVVKIRLMGR